MRQRADKYPQHRHLGFGGAGKTATTGTVVYYTVKVHKIGEGTKALRTMYMYVCTWTDGFRAGALVSPLPHRSHRLVGNYLNDAV